MVDSIRKMGLEIAPEKIEAIFVFDKMKGKKSPPVNIKRLGPWRELKYVGLILDGRWEFSAHFERLAPSRTSHAKPARPRNGSAAGIYAHHSGDTPLWGASMGQGGVGEHASRKILNWV